MCTRNIATAAFTHVDVKHNTNTDMKQEITMQITCVAESGAKKESRELEENIEQLECHHI